jgi:hypothetical protein
MIDTPSNTTSLEQLKDAYEEARGKHLKLNMSRPSLI